tara:strand:- start:1273 stop:3162 length:1890 start_codon:yes stop_codon:yes gene_type:complete
MNNIDCKANKSNGFILFSTSLGIFVVLSFFAFYLARFSSREIVANTNYLNDIRAINLAQTGLEHGIQLLKTSISSLSNPVTGTFNNGQFKISVNQTQDENGSSLPFSHYHLLNSTATLGNVERNTRIIVSPYPQAFNLAFYGKNAGSTIFSSSSTIDGDIYFNGNIGSVNLTSGKVAYTSLENPGNNAEYHGTPLVDFPVIDNTYYQDLLGTVTGSYFTGDSEPMLSFDGANDYAAIQNMYYTDVGEISKLTVSAWVKVPLDGGDWSIVDFDRSEYYTCAVGISNVNGEGNYVGFHTRGSSGGIKDMKSTSTMRDNQWHHIVWVFDSGEVYDKKIYIDGQLDSQQNAYSTNVNLGSGANRYGFFGDGSEASSYNANRNGIYYQGHMDQVSIWHRAFSANEISSLLNVDVNATGLVAYWPMNEGTGNSISDQGPNNYNATTYNGPTWGTRGSNETIVSDQTINLSSINNENTLMQQSALTLSNCTINGPGKILCTGGLTFSDGTVINGNVVIVSGGNISVTGGSTVGNSIASSCILYSSSTMAISGSSVYGLLICSGASFAISGSSSVYGGIYTLSASTLVSGSTITGSIVSKYSLSLNSSNLIRGSLPIIFGTSYGFNGMVIPGSYLEY